MKAEYLLPGVALFATGFVILFALLGSVGALAKSRQFAAMRQLASLPAVSVEAGSARGSSLPWVCLPSACAGPSPGSRGATWNAPGPAPRSVFPAGTPPAASAPRPTATPDDPNPRACARAARRRLKRRSARWSSESLAQTRLLSARPAAGSAPPASSTTRSRASRRYPTRPRASAPPSS